MLGTYYASAGSASGHRHLKSVASRDEARRPTGCGISRSSVIASHRKSSVIRSDFTLDSPSDFGMSKRCSPNEGWTFHMKPSVVGSRTFAPSLPPLCAMGVRDQASIGMSTISRWSSAQCAIGCGERSTIKEMFRSLSSSESATPKLRAAQHHVTMSPIGLAPACHPALRGTVLRAAVPESPLRVAAGSVAARTGGRDGETRRPLLRRRCRRCCRRKLPRPY